MLATLENPEPRYSLECYPVIIVLASAVVAQGKTLSEEVDGRGRPSLHCVG
jgi:hypothetical protein